MDEIIDIVGEAVEPVAEALKDWGEDILDSVKQRAPQYIRYALYALKGLHI